MAGESKMQAWQPEEIQELLEIWTDKNIQSELDFSIRNEWVYSQISSQLLQKGVHRSAKQCREKIKKMKQEYKKLKELHNKTGLAPTKNKYYEKLDSVLDNRPTVIGSQVMNSANSHEAEDMNEGTEDLKSPIDDKTMVLDSGDSQDAGSGDAQDM
uniref:myb/SANT-like DNA-binding domain-containing protein 7 n=1 Tax=Myxine glutinosa TaxID=7769 RepID=UPI00358F7C8A